MPRSIWGDTTEALRARSPEMLRRYLFDVTRAGTDDPRDLMMAMAPYHHCASRLGEDPARVFADVAAKLQGETAELVREFGERRDITASSFGFVLDEDADGPFYRAMTQEEDARETEQTLAQFLRWHPIWRMRHRRAQRRAGSG